MMAKTWLSTLHKKKGISFEHYYECNTVRVGMHLEDLTTAGAEDCKKSFLGLYDNKKIELIYRTLA